MRRENPASGSGFTLEVMKASRLTQLLEEHGAGKPEALEELFALVYPELRARARVLMAGERPGHTLPPTALVHEAFLRLFDGKPAPWEDGPAFLRAAAVEMRRVLVDHARRANAAKRQWRQREPLAGEAERAESAGIEPEELLDLDRALAELAAEDPEAATLVELRYFAGLDGEEAAAAVGLARRTADRRWAWARAWLLRRLNGEPVS